MVDFDIHPDDFVQIAKVPNLVFRVELVQYSPPVGWDRVLNKTWAPRAFLHFAGGVERFDFSYLARWEPLENLVKLNEMEAIARVATVNRRRRGRTGNGFVERSAS